VPDSGQVVVLISADAEWNAVHTILLTPEGSQEKIKDYKLPGDLSGQTPYGGWITVKVHGNPVIFMHGGWGKVAAAASTQYCIDRWKPDLIVNLGTCGGFAGLVECGTILLVERTLIYDIIEQMGDQIQATAFYKTDLDLTWLGELPSTNARRCTLVSADRDILLEDVDLLKEKYQAIAADWESGAIAWVAKRNGVNCLILRTVSDLVSPCGGEAYGDYALFVSRTKSIFKTLINELPWWLDRFFTIPNGHAPPQ
jgi:adenosylhomocysteine nucleosidase